MSSSPNTGFLVQLELFHKASFRISQRDKSTRMFYMERAVEEVMSAFFKVAQHTRIYTTFRRRWHPAAYRHVCQIPPNSVRFDAEHAWGPEAAYQM